MFHEFLKEKRNETKVRFTKITPAHISFFEKLMLK